MIRINISVLKKIGKSGITHWRQIVLLMSADTEKYTLRTYYGRKIHKMKKENELSYEELAFANRDFCSFTEQRCNDGYEVIEFLCAPMDTKTLEFFKPPRFNMPKGEQLHNMFMTEKRRLAIPIESGMRVYIKIGCETVCSVKAIDALGNNVILPSNVTEDLQKCIKMGRMEVAIIEGYLDTRSLMITDVAAINGLNCEHDFEKRIKLVCKYFSGRESLQICTPVEVSEKLLEEFNDARCVNVRYYIVKELNKGFEQAEAFAGNNFVIPNFYSMEMTVLERPSYGKKEYKVGLIADNGYYTMGFVESSKPLSESENVTINFTNMTEGNIGQAWVCDDDSYRDKAFGESSIEQLYNGSDCWAARLHFQKVG